MASIDRAWQHLDEQLPDASTRGDHVSQRTKQHSMKRLKRLSRRMIAILAGLAAVVAPATFALSSASSLPRRRWAIMPMLLGVALTVAVILAPTPSAARASEEPQVPSTSADHVIAEPSAAARDARLAAAGALTTLSFSEFPVNTPITDHYITHGVIFTGGAFISPDGANPTSPVLSGTPRFRGSISGSFVLRGTKSPAPVDSFAVDVGYIDDPGSVAVDAYDRTGSLLTRVLANQRGIVRLTIAARDIASFRVASVGSEAAGFAIDNLTFEPTDFVFAGSIPVPADPHGVQAVGSPALAERCATPGGQRRFRVAKEKAIATMALMVASNAPHGIELLNHFLAGTGSSVDYPDSEHMSSVSGKVRRSPTFKMRDEIVQKDVARQATSGASDITLTAPTLETVDFPLGGDLDLVWAFRGTQGLDVEGSGRREGDRLIGTVTYTIRDSYGFANNDKFFGVGRDMHFLQTVCGAPDYPGGAHWFPSSVTVTVPFDQPA